ncbi:MAG: class I tRNA ligase family protein, partial [Chthoniobacteraceae bacterium]
MQNAYDLPPAVTMLPRVARASRLPFEASRLEHRTSQDHRPAIDRLHYPDVPRETRGTAGGTPALPGAALAGSEAHHPFLDRTSRIITADFVTMETGTGQVHIAPGHGKDDYIAGQQNGLPVLSPVDDFGKFTEDVGVPAWVGKYVFDANAEIVTFLRESGALLGEQKYTHDYPHCWRSKTPIVFRAVEQFFMRIEAFRAEALAAIDSVNWLPPSARNRIYGTVEARPDWCISRQRTW